MRAKQRIFAQVNSFQGTRVPFFFCLTKANVAQTFQSFAAGLSAAMAVQGPGPGSPQLTRKPVLWQNNPSYQLLVDAGLELIENEGAGICFAACGQQALVAHCARQGKRVPPALPQNARQMRTLIIDFIVHHRCLSATGSWAKSSTNLSRTIVSLMSS